MAKWKEIPSPEAIVQAALERAADFCKPVVDEAQAEVYRLMRERGGGKAEDVWTGRLVAAQTLMAAFLALASDPAEVAAIIKKAGEDRDDLANW